MAVLNRKMFSRGGFAHRGTGITTGLATPKRGYVDRPGSYQGVGESSLPTGTAGLLESDSNAVNTGPEPAGKVLSAPFKARDFSEIFAEKQGILEALRPPTQEFSKFDAAAPALMTFFGNLMSGKSFQSGFSGAFDIAGNALTESTPQFSQALAAKRAAEAADRKEKFALDLQAYESAETAQAAELAREAKAMEVNYRKDTETYTDPDTGRLMIRDRETLDDGVTWTPMKGSERPANADTYVKDSSGTYTVGEGEDAVEFEGYQIIEDNKPVIKRMDNDEIIDGAKKKTEYELGGSIYGVINSDDGSFTGLQLDLATEEGLANFEKILKQEEGDTILINGREVSVKDLAVTTANPEFDKEPELGDNVYTVYDKQGKATGEQIDLAAEGGPERYQELLADTEFTLAKVSINAADATSLASNLPKSYGGQLQVNQDSAILFTSELLPAYLATQQPDFIAKDTIVGTAFSVINNLKSNIDNVARLYITDAAENNPLFVDENGEGIQQTTDQFLEAFKLKSDANRSLVEEVAAGGELFESRIIGLAYTLALQNNPDGRISEPDFKYALKQLKGSSADPKIIADVMLTQYGKSKNKYILNWINQSKLDNPTIPNTDKEGKTLYEKGEEEFFLRSPQAQKFEEIIAAKDKQNNTKKKDIIVSEGLKFPIPQTFNDMKLIEDGKLAQTFLQQWLNSPSPVEGQTMGEYVKSNNLLLTYTDTEGEQKIIKISEK
jgi:hypothetical protein